MTANNGQLKGLLRALWILAIIGLAIILGLAIMAQGQVETTTDRVRYDCDGTSKDFVFRFPVFATSEICVLLIDANGVPDVLTSNSHYTVTLPNGDGFLLPGGTVTTVAAYSSSYDLEILRVPELTQGTNYETATRLDLATLQDDFDRAVMRDQYLQAQIRRGLRGPLGDVGDFNLPARAERANSYVIFDADGDVSTASAALPGGELLTPYWELIVAEPNLTDSLLALGLATKAGNETVRSLLQQPYVNVRDYGAAGDGVTDDSNAVQAAILDGVALARAIYFPPGVYRVVEPNTLMHASSNHYGMHLVGAGRWLSKIYFEPNVAEAWLWQHDEATYAEFWATFDSLGFFAYGYTQSAGVSPYHDPNACGFNLHRDSHFLFRDCQFRGFQTLFKTTGTTYASGITLDGCRVSHIGGPVLHLDNAQSVDHRFYATGFSTILNDLIYVDTGGGGQVSLYGCYVNMVNLAADSNDHYILNVVGSANIGQTNHRFTFLDTKVEANSSYSCLVKKTETAGSLRAAFIGSNLAAHTGDDRNAVDIEYNAEVTFTDCTLGDWMYLVLTGDATHIPHVRVTGCSVPEAFEERVTITDYGRFSMRDCTSSTQDTANSIQLVKTAGLVDTMFVLASAAAPADPCTGTIYLDDGTNTAWSGPGLRRYSGAAWADLGPACLNGSAAKDPNNIADEDVDTFTIAVSGAALGDFALASFSLDSNGLTITASVVATDTVRVKFSNLSGGSINLGAGTIYVRVWKK